MTSASPRRAGPLPWRRSVAWLLFLAPFFFATYGFANGAAARHADPAVVAWDWERAIPFLPWTIVPYWSIDLLYGLSFLACRTRHEVDRHGLRLLTVQLVAIACFLAWPMRFSFERPAAEGAFGALFAVLASFDGPYNQAPSLHIALLVVIWSRLARVLHGWAGALGHAWLALIGISVLTTWQHHFVDVPTGALLGFFALWLWPDEGRSPLASFAKATDPHRRVLALRYAAGAAALALVAALARGTWLWLLWPSVSLALVALAYAALGPAAFQKRGATHALASRVLLAPYTLGAWINSRLWTRRHPQPDEVADGVWIGRMPACADLARHRFAATVDVCAELPSPACARSTVALPWLDLVAPDARALREAASAIERARAHGDVLVCCALGYGRSACAVAAWLVGTGRSPDAGAAMRLVARKRPGVTAPPGAAASLAALEPRAGRTS